MSRLLISLVLLSLVLVSNAATGIKDLTLTGTFTTTGVTNKSAVLTSLGAQPLAANLTALANNSTSTLTLGNITISFKRIDIGTVSTGIIRDGVDNTTGDLVAAKEILIENTAPSANVLALRNNSSTGFSAIEFRSNTNVANMAIGDGNASSTVPMFSGAGYIEMWNKTGAPQPFIIAMDGNYGSTGSGFRFYRRTVYGSDGTIKHYRLEPYGTAQEYPFWEFNTRGNFTTGYLGYQFPVFAAAGTGFGGSFWQNAQAGGIALGHDGAGHSVWWGASAASGSPTVYGVTAHDMDFRTGMNENAADPWATGTTRLKINTNGVAIGSGGAAMAIVLTGTATLDFASTAAQTGTDLTITVTGAATGDCVLLATPTASVTTGGSFSAWVSATNTVTVRFLNASSSARDPASGVFRASIIRF